ncbi:17862_t:CDS:2 [Entrophospora sp. SA101]|nr:149_t:CDS:2 [Entrophospora sp. SA101]CAJ0856798.1 2419_t:CDS:2 [Entrophospora sp. SA101]CAJ0905110.1 17862_t:CDS:2 [Entrophospora sp. SA101]
MNGKNKSDLSIGINQPIYGMIPNTTSHLQPCDVGIIHSFKAQYKKISVYDRIEAYVTAQTLEMPVAPVIIYDAICFAKKHGATGKLVMENEDIIALI